MSKRWIGVRANKRPEMDKITDTDGDVWVKGYRRIISTRLGAVVFRDMGTYRLETFFDRPELQVKLMDCSFNELSLVPALPVDDPWRYSSV